MRRGESQKARKAEKLRQSVGAAMTKQRVGNIHMLSWPPKKPGGQEVNDTNSAKTITCYISSDHENSDKTRITDMLGKMKVPNTVQMEKETNQDKKGPLPWDVGNDFGFSYQRENKTDKEKNQVTTSAGKEDDADSTVTETTAAFTSVCELEWDDYTTIGLAETTSFGNHTYVFGKRRWVKPARKWRTPTPQVCRENSPH